MKAKLSVKIVGCGGIGSCLLNVLPRYFNYLNDYEVELHLIDGDRFEAKNATRQTVLGYGNKAVELANEIRSKFSDFITLSNPNYITNLNIPYIIGENDVVMSCVDNHKTRKLLSDHCCMLNNVVLISGGNELTDGNIQVHIRKSGQNITIPIANKYHPEIVNPNDMNPGEDHIGCGVRQAISPQLLATNNFIAALMFNALDSYLRQVEFTYDEAYADINVNAVVPKVRKK